MATSGSRSEKVNTIFQQFDANRDGGLNRDHMAALVVAVNPRVNSVGDVDRDFDALSFDLKPTEEAVASSSSVTDERFMEPHKKQRTAAWAASPNHGIVFDDTWKLVDDLETLIKRLKTKHMKDGKIKNDSSDLFSDPGWSREIGPSSEMLEKRVIWDETGSDYASFVKELGVLRSRADRAHSRAGSAAAAEED